MKIGLRIKERRKALGMSADELGAILGKNRSTIYRYENGDIENMPLDILEPIAAALKTTPQYLMGWDKVKEKADTIAGVALRMKNDSEFLELIKKLYLLDSEQIKGVNSLLSAFLK